MEPIPVTADGNTPDGDPFNEDLSEYQFLLSKPTCFIIIGKPGSGKTTLAKKLAQLWRCEMVNATQIILREIDLGTEIGKRMQEILLKGETLSTDFIVQLLREKVTSPEVAHYGYVLDDLPTLDDQAMSIQQQIEMIKSWKLNPTFIINIKIPDKDLNIRRIGLRTDSYTGDIIPKKMWDVRKPVAAEFQEGEQEEDGEEAEEGEEQNEDERETVTDFPEVDKETKERLAHSPENQSQQVECSSNLYKDHALKLLEDYIVDFDQQYLIELDGNNSPSVMFQHLLKKLDTFTCRRAVVPIRLQNPDEEELPDEIDTEELLRTLASYEMIAPRYRWRRSKWGRLCPVALKDGNIIQGKPDLAVSFLDKMYVLSSPEAMEKFLKNPRPYLLPPMPSPPCKVAVLGFPLTGKSTLCKELSEKYKAHIFDMKQLMASTFEEQRKLTIEKVRQETLESAIILVQNKLEQEAMERAEKSKKEAEEAALKLESQTENEEEAETQNSPEKVSEEDAGISEKVSEEDAGILPAEDTETEVSEQREPSPVPTVTEEHEEVKSLVAEAVKKAEQQDIKLPPETYINILKQELDKMLQERLSKDPNAPKDGGWILDGFPENKDHWAVMLDAGIIPDQTIFLTDKSLNYSTIKQRHYESNKEEIVQQYRSRMIKEKQDALLEQTQFNSEPKEIKEPDSVDEQKESETDHASESESVSESVKPESTQLQEEAKRLKIMEEIEELEKLDLEVPSYDVPEFQNLSNTLREFDKEWNALHSSITGTAPKNSLSMDISGKTVVGVLNESSEKIESPFGYQAWEFSGMDLDEEEEDGNAEMEALDESQEEEEDEEAVKNKRKHFGYTKHYDPVAMKDEFVLWPGNPDIAAKHREKVYFFKSSDCREMFLQNPTTYLPDDKPLVVPPPRIIILGARGSGKTLQGRFLAEKLGVFHITFRERLQEMILPKTNKKLGPEHEEKNTLDKELSVSVEDAVNNALNNPEPAETTDEEEKFDFTDEEEAIRNNLMDDEPLFPEILEKIVFPWWREEPYRSTGFILEGFPRTTEECQFLAQSGLFPDGVLFLMVEDNDIVKRLLPGRMQVWKKLRDYRNEVKQTLKERKEKIKADKIAQKRAVLIQEMKEKKQRLAEEQSDKDEDDDDDDEEDDIEDQLAAEFDDDEEGEEEEEEQEEDVSDKTKAELAEGFDDDVNKLQTIQDQLEEFNIPRLEVQGSRKSSIVKYLIEAKLKHLIEYRRSTFEQVYPVSEAVASKMLITGYKHPSLFGNWDPVKILEENAVLPPLHDLNNPAFPVVYNQYIYYLSSLNSRNLFTANPIHYVLNRPAAKPAVAIQLAVVGPPKSGKTALAEYFANQYGTARISIGGCIKRVLEQQPDSILASSILSHLHEGNVVPDALAVEALAGMLLDSTCKTRGYVLDGYPNTEQQVKLMNNRRIIPVRIIELDIDGKEVLRRAEQDRNSAKRKYPMHDSENITVVKHALYKENITAIQKWYSSQHHNWCHIDAMISKWKLRKRAEQVTNESIINIQDYYEAIANGKAAKLFGLCVSPAEFEARLGSYGHYCPVSLNLYGELVDCSSDSYLPFCVEYRSKYYKLSSQKTLELFLEHPERYVEPLAQIPLPPANEIPTRRTRDEAKAQFPKQFELNGYCPVTFHEGKLRYEALAEGDSELVVEYKEKLYIFEDENKLTKFMRIPTKYCDLQLPNKLPPKKQPIDIHGLPMLGYLEQGASTCLIKALTAVGCLKPKYPFISIKKSSIVYVACHLKAYNPRHSAYIRNKYRTKLEHFEEKCQLITYLASNMTRRYHEPVFRPVDFDHKMGLFLSLEDNPPKHGVAF